MSKHHQVEVLDRNNEPLYVLPIEAGIKGQVLIRDEGINTKWGSRDTQAISAIQTGGTNGRVVRCTGANTWANASNTDASDSLYGILLKSLDGEYKRPGDFVELTNLTANTVYYLGVDGLLTADEPVISTTVTRVTIGRAINPNLLLFFPSTPIRGT